jgi:hypothetical protein
METSVISRRGFLGMGAALSGASSWRLMAGEKKPDSQLFASAFSLNKNQHFFTLFNEEGEIKWQQALPERAHAPIVHPTQSLIAIVARRPGYNIDIYDVHTGELVRRILPDPDHHFYGHGLFSADGKKLITQENHYPSGEGKIIIRSLESGKVLKRFSSYGIGPHESCLLDDNTLVVANGGLKTHPENDRRILNLDDMQANLAFISLENGKLLNKIQLPDELHQLSIRHLDINQAGTVALGFQYQGDKWDQVPLIATATINDNTFNLLNLPSDIERRLTHYCGSVTFDQSGQTLAVSSPRGDLVVYWDIVNDQYLGHHNYQDVCGISATANKQQFLITTGKGKRIFVNPITNDTIALATMRQWKWDNHIHLLKI